MDFKRCSDCMDKTLRNLCPVCKKNYNRIKSKNLRDKNKIIHDKKDFKPCSSCVDLPYRKYCKSCLKVYERIKRQKSRLKNKNKNIPSSSGSINDSSSCVSYRKSDKECKHIYQRINMQRYQTCHFSYLGKKKKKFSSKVWKYFIKTDDNQAQCKLCGVIVHRNKGTTLAMLAHLKKEFKDYKYYSDDDQSDEDQSGDSEDVTDGELAPPLILGQSHTDSAATHVDLLIPVSVNTSEASGIVIKKFMTATQFTSYQFKRFELSPSKIKTESPTVDPPVDMVDMMMPESQLLITIKPEKDISDYELLSPSKIKTESQTVDPPVDMVDMMMPESQLLITIKPEKDISDYV